LTGGRRPRSPRDDLDFRAAGVYHPGMADPTVQTGLDRLLTEGCAPLRGRRCGLLCHPASIDRELRHAARLLHEAPGVDLRALFGPQHGIRGETQDNMIEWDGFRDPATGLPVHSLYGATRKPTAAMLAGLDTLIVDLQDVGARYYTFIWTLLLCMEACAEAGIEVVVLDRPNPLGGLAREGALLAPAYRSFVGLAPLPMRHGLTVGELARLFRARQVPACRLEVIPLRGWRREMDFEATGLPWIMPSPNLPTVDTAWVYPGMCLIEGTLLSEGRGTTRPFEIFGAPGLDPDALGDRLDAWRLPGVMFRPLHFLPTFQKHAQCLCGGAQIHVTDRRAFRPCLTAVAVLCAARAAYGDRPFWREPPYEYETVKPPIDVLAGGPALREAIDAGRDPWEIAATWAPDEAEFAAGAREFLLYA
jgi:uncharacterized protein YbbC (DUF1343 family)